MRGGCHGDGAMLPHRLGLHYIKLHKDSEAPDGADLETAAEPGKGKMEGDKQAAKEPPQQPQQQLTSAELLLRFSPPHAHGHWQQHDTVTQAHLRRHYQGA